MADVRGFLRGRVAPLLRRGRRTVIWSHPQFDLGNYLYLWQRAWLRQEAGADCVVRRNSKIQRWLPHFPYVREHLDVAEHAVAFQDQRDLHNHQVFGVDFDGEQNAAFVRAVLLPSPAIASALPDAGPDVVTLNVRRGDYYSDPVFRGQYSFDIVEYVRTALATTEERDGPVAHVRVVSDGIDWCRDRLGWLASDRSVEFVDGLSPIEAFALLSGSRRLVVTNSTFSYWAAHVSTARHGDNHPLVYAPWFHRRDIDGGAAWQLDPRWSIVKDVRGGWDA